MEHPVVEHPVVEQKLRFPVNEMDPMEAIPVSFEELVQVHRSVFGSWFGCGMLANFEKQKDPVPC